MLTNDQKAVLFGALFPLLPRPTNRDPLIEAVVDYILLDAEKQRTALQEALQRTKTQRQADADAFLASIPQRQADDIALVMEVTDLADAVGVSEVPAAVEVPAVP